MTDAAQPTPNPIVIININEPPKPPDHVHKWAWAVLARGGEVQVCYGCGKERR